MYNKIEIMNLLGKKTFKKHPLLVFEAIGHFPKNIFVIEDGGTPKVHLLELEKQLCPRPREAEYDSYIAQ